MFIVPDGKKVACKKRVATLVFSLQAEVLMRVGSQFEDPDNIKQREYRASPERNGGGNGNSPRKHTEQRHLTCENPGVTRPGIEPGSPWWEASRLTAQPPRPRHLLKHLHVAVVLTSCGRLQMRSTLCTCTEEENLVFSPRVELILRKSGVPSPKTVVALDQTCCYIASSRKARVLPIVVAPLLCHSRHCKHEPQGRPDRRKHRCEQRGGPSSASEERAMCVAPLQTRPTTPVFLNALRTANSVRDKGIVLGDAAGRQVFSGISRFPRPFHSGTVPYSPRFTLNGSRDIAVKSRPILFTHSLTLPVETTQSSKSKFIQLKNKFENGGSVRAQSETLTRERYDTEFTRKVKELGKPHAPDSKLKIGRKKEMRNYQERNLLHRLFTVKRSALGRAGACRARSTVIVPGPLDGGRLPSPTSISRVFADPSHEPLQSPAQICNIVVRRGPVRHCPSSLSRVADSTRSARAAGPGHTPYFNLPPTTSSQPGVPDKRRPVCFISTHRQRHGRDPQQPLMGEARDTPLALTSTGLREKAVRSYTSCSGLHPHRLSVHKRAERLLLTTAVHCTTRSPMIMRLGRGKREIPEKTRRPTASSGTIQTYGNPVTLPGIEPCLPWWVVRRLTAQPPRALA
ncbi:hypothetical protein PR048_004406 [Dryococelus australis]|uniref:Uncharacterized protein n=1 Tax=Dryococelus australis TaxID=614101 RepID=A0ABQ9I5D3_9NEOP|nr:hypothetical protein PR048_004406 [Dryococelus australis]